MTTQTTPGTHAHDLAAIRQAALDYMQGWYEGDAERMRQCLHPELAKRAVLIDPETGEVRFSHLTHQQMVAKTQQGGGTDIPINKRYYEASVLDVYGDIACAKAESYEYIDYVQLARCEGSWKIINVLWTFNLTKR